MCTIVAGKPDLVHAVVEAKNAIIGHNLTNIGHDTLRNRRVTTIVGPVGDALPDQGPHFVEVREIVIRTIDCGSNASHAVRNIPDDFDMRKIDLVNIGGIDIDVNYLRRGSVHQKWGFLHSVVANGDDEIGMLTGKMSADSTFASDDHRAFNRHGEAFDVGETFSGVPYDIALKAVDELRGLVPVDASMAQLALRWILMEDAVSVIIPGSKSAAQAASNVSAASLAPLSDEVMQRVREVYQRLIAPHVHQRW